MDVFKTHGAISWSELMTGDPAAAGSFYSQLFGWTMKAMPMGGDVGDYHVANVGETGIGGIMGTPPEAQGMPPRWGIYVTVNSVDESLALAKSLGATVCMEPMDVPGVGRMAAFNDPQGATISIIQYQSS